MRKSCISWQVSRTASEENGSKIFNKISIFSLRKALTAGLTRSSLSYLSLMLQNSIRPTNMIKNRLQWRMSVSVPVLEHPAAPISNMKSINMIKDSHLHNKVCCSDVILWSTRYHVKDLQMHTLDHRGRLETALSHVGKLVLLFSIDF